MLFPRVLAYVWVSVWVSRCPGARAYGCGGVWVSFFFSYLFVSDCFNNTLHSATYIRSRMATFQCGKLPKWEDPKWRAPNKREVESVCVLPNQCTHGPRPTQPTRQRGVTSRKTS